MNLSYTPDDNAFRVRTWLVPRQLSWIARHADAAQAWQRGLYEAGFVGMGWPSAYSGPEARAMERATVAEEMGCPFAPAPDNGVGIGRRSG